MEYGADAGVNVSSYTRGVANPGDAASMGDDLKAAVSESIGKGARVGGLANTEPPTTELPNSDGCASADTSATMFLNPDAS
jgi:hypothetical protein